MARLILFDGTEAREIKVTDEEVKLLNRVRFEPEERTRLQREFFRQRGIEFKNTPTVSPVATA